MRCSDTVTRYTNSFAGRQTMAGTQQPQQVSAEDLERAQNGWKWFTKVSTYATIAVVIVVALMGITLL